MCRAATSTIRRSIGNYLMHCTRFEGTRGVLDGEKALLELDLPPEAKTGTFFPSVHANCMMGFGIDSVSATEVYPEGPEHTVLVSSFLVPKSHVGNLACSKRACNASRPVPGSRCASAWSVARQSLAARCPS
jgi:hypothetical protein